MTEASGGSSTARLRYGRALKWVRRFHMYLGLLLAPWICFYGVSGVLFNHPELGRPMSRQRIDVAEVKATGFSPIDARQVAQQLIAAINLQVAQPVTLDPSTPPALWGWPLFAAPAADGSRYTMIINLQNGEAGLGHAATPTTAPSRPFAIDALELPAFQTQTIAARLSTLLPKHGAITTTPLKPHPKVAPEIRFQVRDAQHTLWNVAWNMTTGALSTHAADAPGPLLVELLATLHTSHHFPIHGGIAFAWALFADMAGLALVLWALTGLAMWWQMKPSRVIGAFAISAAIILAALVMTRMSQEVTFLPLETGGP